MAVGQPIQVHLGGAGASGIDWMQVATVVSATAAAAALFWTTWDRIVERRPRPQLGHHDGKLQIINHSRTGVALNTLITLKPRTLYVKSEGFPSEQWVYSLEGVPDMSVAHTDAFAVQFGHIFPMQIASEPYMLRPTVMERLDKLSAPYFQDAGEDQLKEGYLFRLVCRGVIYHGKNVDRMTGSREYEITIFGVALRPERRKAIEGMDQEAKDSVSRGLQFTVDWPVNTPFNVSRDA